MTARVVWHHRRTTMHPTHLEAEAGVARRTLRRRDARTVRGQLWSRLAEAPMHRTIEWAAAALGVELLPWQRVMVEQIMATPGARAYMHVGGRRGGRATVVRVIERLEAGE